MYTAMLYSTPMSCGDCESMILQGKRGVRHQEPSFESQELSWREIQDIEGSTVIVFRVAVLYRGYNPKDMEENKGSKCGQAATNARGKMLPFGNSRQVPHNISLLSSMASSPPKQKFSTGLKFYSFYHAKSGRQASIIGARG